VKHGNYRPIFRRDANAYAMPAGEKAKGATGDDQAFRAIQADVLEYLTRSLTEIQFYA